ncbi:hypothetical protein V6Z11_D03G107500 [Gossypium hirsutum]
MTKIIQRIAQKKEAKKVIEPLCPKIQKKLDTKTELCNRNSINVLTIMMMLQERLESYADPCYHQDAHTVSIYSHLIKPIRGAKQWSQVQSIEPYNLYCLEVHQANPAKQGKRE